MQLSAIVAELNRRRPGRDWNQMCQALVWNVVDMIAGAPRSYESAAAARGASTIVSMDANAAPAGAIHYWRNPADGHVAVSLGGGRVLMTGTQAALGTGGRMLGTNFGITTVSAYTSIKGNPYMGWARSNGANPSIIDRVSDDVGGGGSSGTSSGADASVSQWRTIQDWLKRLGRYSGPVDGVPGVETWKGVQRTVAKYGLYNGPIDGVPGANTFKAMQTYARNGGYSGPVDGALGANSWSGFVARLSS